MSIVLGVYEVGELSLAKKIPFLLINKMGIILRPGGVQVARQRGRTILSSCLVVLEGLEDYHCKLLYTLEYLALDKLPVSESSFRA